jgi:HEAT repeat protein
MSSVSYRFAASAFLTTCLVLTSLSPAWGQASSATEAELIAVLQSDAAPAEKAITCKRLAVVGTETAVPELAKLLPDEQLHSWARIALEAIPGAASDEALRTAAGSLEGRLLVGVVNSIGVRRDAGAVELLTGLLQNDDAIVASSAAVALGRIGSEPATKTLRDALAGAPEGVRSAVAEACVLCAEKALADGRAAEAIEIYDQVRTAEVPKQRVIEATRGAILARGDEGIPLLVEQLKSADKGLFQIALTTAREIPGDKIDAALAAELPNAAPFRAPLLIAAMADRPETVVLTAIQEAAAAGPNPVRVAAIEALGRVGDESCLDSLLEIAGGEDAELAQTAKAALAVLPGDNVNQQIVAHLDSAQGGQYLALIETIGERRIDAVDSLLKAVNNSDQAVRNAALASLGETIPASQLSVLINQVIAPKNASDAPAAQQALKAAAIRMPDREDCAAQLTAALAKAPVATKIVLLEILAAVGGSNALEAIHTAAADPQLRDASTRLLGEWLTIDAAPVLLDIATTGPADRFQTRAYRGYVRIARQFVMEDAERLAMCRKALEAARQPADKKSILEILERYPTPEMLKLAIELMQTPELKDDALRSVLVVAQKIEGHADDVQAQLKDARLPKFTIEIVKAEYGAGGNQKDVTDILKQGVSEGPVVTLPSANYNGSFGGDPAPDTPKQLKVQYKINGQDAEATFAENRLVVLTLPKP